MQAGQRKYLNSKLKANSTSIFVFRTWKCHPVITPTRQVEDSYPYIRGLKPRNQIQGVLSFPAGHPVTHPALEAKTSPEPVTLKPLDCVENYNEQKGKDGMQQQQGPTEQT